VEDIPFVAKSSILEPQEASSVLLTHNPLFHGCRSIDEYERLSYISQGTYGVVFRAKCRTTNKVYAIKQVKLGPESNKVGFPISALRETNILLSLNHENIIKVREMVVGSSTDKVFMVSVISLD
jgi:cell division cycle 2-like protein